MKKKVYFGIHVGSASILLIFIVLCLVSLAVLSLASASADDRLSQKIANREVAYYEACNQVEANLQVLDQKLLASYQQCPTQQEYLALASQYQLTYVIPISDIQSLKVEVTPVFPTNDQPHFYEIVCWKTIMSAPLEYDDSLHVFTDY